MIPEVSRGTTPNTSTEVSPEAKSTGTVKQKNYRKTAQKVIESNYANIVQKLADEAQNGSVRHTKLLFDLGGVQEAVKASAPRAKRPPSLGRILLKEAAELKRKSEKALQDSAETKLDGTPGN